jgi:hypothetical protein
MLPNFASLNDSSACIPFNFFNSSSDFDYSLYELLTTIFLLTTVVHVIMLANPGGEIYRLMSGDRTGQSAVLLFLTTFPKVSSLRCAISCQNVEACRYDVSTLVLLFQKARTSNKHWFILQKFLQFNEQL